MSRERSCIGLAKPSVRARRFDPAGPRMYLSRGIKSRLPYPPQKVTRRSALSARSCWRTEKNWGPRSRPNEETAENSLSLQDTGRDACNGSDISGRQFRPNGRSEINIGEG